MKYLILAFTLLLTPFFSVSQTTEPDSVSPKVQLQICVIANFNGTQIEQCAETEQQAKSGVCPLFASNYPAIEKPEPSWPNLLEWRTAASCDENYRLSYTRYRQGANYDWNEQKYIPATIQEFEDSYGSVAFVLGEEIEMKGCPPDDYPLYTIGVDVDDDGEIDQCTKDSRLDECPSGYYKYKANGVCQPVRCDAQGDSKNIWASGSVYGNGQGTYCDGSCAHTVTGGQNPDNRSGNISITAVSTGQSCGSGHPDDRWMNEGDEGNCSSTDVGTGTGFLACPPDGNTETPPEEPPEEPPVDLGDEKANENDIPTLIPIEDVCMPGDASCEFKNLKAKIESEGQEQKQLETSLHNKRVEAIEKTTTSLTKSVNDSAQRNSDGLKVVSDAINSLTKSIEDGSGGGGDSDDGFCDSDGNCSTSVEIKTEPSQGLTGFWKTEYEDGFEGMFMAKIEEYRQTELFLFLDNFQANISGGAAPDFDWCFNFGGYMNLGCSSLTIDPRIFPALKIFLLISAAFACRIIIFGG